VKDRLLTLVLAVAAFVLFFALMGPRPAPPTEPVTRPTTVEPGPNGYLGVMRWLEASGFEPISFRERYTRLSRIDAPATGNLLITAAPHLYPIRDSEVAPLRDWISAGNTLLVAAGLSDTPEWSMGEGRDPQFLRNMHAMTGLEFLTYDVEAEPSDDDAQDRPASDRLADAFRRMSQPQAFEMTPAGSHPLLAGVSSVAALSEFPTAQWQAYSGADDLVLELAHDPVTRAPALWLVRFGAGQVIVSAYGSVFTNKLLGKADNARLLSNIVEWSLGPSGRVLIDDAHQGLVAFYDPQAFYGDRRLHLTLLWLVALWLVFVLGPQRLRPAASRWDPIGLTRFVRASGGFMRRVLEPSAAAKQLFANFFNEARRQRGLPQTGAPVWEWIEQHADVAPHDIEELRRLYVESERGRRVSLTALHNLLLRFRQQLQ
jgi:hypothetical protein